MKKNQELIFAIIVGVLIFLIFSSCEKEDSFCYTCVQTTRTTVSVYTPGYPQVTTATFESCDGDKSDYTKATVTQGGITATTTVTTNCVKK